MVPLDHPGQAHQQTEGNGKSQGCPAFPAFKYEKEPDEQKGHGTVAADKGLALAWHTYLKGPYKIAGSSKGVGLEGPGTAEHSLEDSVDEQTRPKQEKQNP